MPRAKKQTAAEQLAELKQKLEEQKRLNAVLTETIKTSGEPEGEEEPVELHNKPTDRFGQVFMDLYVDGKLLPPPVQPKVGRPSKYDTSYCAVVIELGKLGKSQDQMAAHLGISYKTLDNWKNEQEEFLQALEIANTLALNWWETLQQHKAIEGGGGEATMGRAMSARFPHRYREKLALTDADGSALRIKFEV
jgi:hypothetical protein